MVNDKFYRRRYVITTIVIAIVAIFTIRLFVLQIVDDQKEAAETNAMYKQTIFPPRGLIYDRDSNLLVFNQPVYEVTLTMRGMKEGFDTLQFCQTLGIDTLFFEERITDIKNRRKNRAYSQNTPQIFLSNLTAEDIAPLQESRYLFHGVDIRTRTIRDYTYSAAAQVLGSVGEVSQADIDKDSYYSAGDYSGRDGIEKTYEKVLRGEKGMQVLMRDSKGRIQGAYDEGKLDKDAVKGEDLQLTLDIHLQLLAEELLTGKLGSIVAIEPKTGEILALASNPTWNPKLLVGRERSKNYRELHNDPTKPLLNRATQAVYPPGSTFKTLQSAIFLSDGTITPRTAYPCGGKGTKPISCTHSHGSPVTLLGALEQSCNPYYWGAYRDFLERNGYGKDNEDFRERYGLWREMVSRFGLGAKFTDSDLSEQSRGNLPTTAFFDKYYGKKGWKAITIRSLSIGQGEITVTPLQLANMAATIANNGYYITPHLCRHDSMLTHRHETGIEAKHFEIVKEGMHRVMTDGTGRWYQIEGINMGGKTGTAQAGKGRKDHALFICIAPIEDPQIVVAVVVENSGFGATWAAPMGSLVVEQYLKDTISRPELRRQMSTAILNPEVRTKDQGTRK